MSYTPDLDALEARAVEAITRLYGPVHNDLTAAFWVQKGIEGMRLAVAEWGESSQLAPDERQAYAD